MHKYTFFFLKPNKPFILKPTLRAVTPFFELPILITQVRACILINQLLNH